MSTFWKKKKKKKKKKNKEINIDLFPESSNGKRHICMCEKRV